MAFRGFLGTLPINEEQEATAPQMLSASATSPTTIQVNYNQNMADDVLTPGNYTLQSSGGAIPNISTIEFYPAGQLVSVKITLDAEMTSGATYTITASNVHSERGLLIDPDYDSADFLGQGEPPYVVDAVAVNGSLIQVLFNEPMSDVNLGDINSYGFSPNTFTIKTPTFGAHPVVVSLELDTGEMINGQDYLLTVSDTLRDEANNLIRPDGRTAHFDGIGTLPQIVTAYFYTPEPQYRIRVSFSEPMDTTTVLNKNNYTLSAINPNTNPVPAIFNVALIDPYTVDVITAAFSSYGTYRITGSSNIKDVVGNPLDPDHNAADFLVSISPPVIKIYPESDNMTFSSTDPVRVVIYDTGTGDHFGLNPATINIKFQNDMFAVAAGELNGNLFNISMSGSYTSKDGVTYEIIQKPEWEDNSYVISVEATDIANNKNRVVSTFFVQSAGCWENKKPLSDLEAKFYLPFNQKIYETLRTILLASTKSRADYAGAKTTLFLASISDALALVSDYIGTTYVDGKLCFRKPILEIDANLKTLLPQLSMAVRLEKSMPQELREKFISFLESESPVYRVNGAAALLVYLVARR